MYLNPEERKQSALIYRGLIMASELVSEGERDAARICDAVREVIAKAPLATIQYLELVDPDTMKPVEKLNTPGLLAVAVYFGHTRLIDNVILKP